MKAKFHRAQKSHSMEVDSGCVFKEAKMGKEFDILST